MEAAQKPKININPEIISENSENRNSSKNNLSDSKFETSTLSSNNYPASSKLLEASVKSSGFQILQAASTKSLIKPLPKEKDEKLATKERNSFCHTDEPPDDVPRTPISDGYTWRKYGQKQVKSSGSSRSYYRCTYLSCYAKKKVQQSDVSGKIIEVVYKGDHNHDPPQILMGSSRKKDFSPRPLNSHVQIPNPPHFLTCEREFKQSVPLTPECRDNYLKSSAGILSQDDEQHIKIVDTTSRPESELAIVPKVEERSGSRSDNSDEHIMTDPMKVPEIAPLKKRRIKESGQACSEPVYRTFKDPKIVMHAVGDVGTSSDGYRWRKYGQKMVKGNPHPRCSSAGCPVRKHVERASDDSTAIVVTYEGNHDHNTPTPKRYYRLASPKVTASGPTVLFENSEIKSPSQGSAKDQSKSEIKSLCQGFAEGLSKSEIKSLSQGSKDQSNSEIKYPSQGSAEEQSISENISPSEEPAEELSKDLDSDHGEEKASEAGGDRVLESARTLLSIGIELKSC